MLMSDFAFNSFNKITIKLPPRKTVSKMNSSLDNSDIQYLLDNGNSK